TFGLASFSQLRRLGRRRLTLLMLKVASFMTRRQLKRRPRSQSPVRRSPLRADVGWDITRVCAMIASPIMILATARRRWRGYKFPSIDGRRVVLRRRGDGRLTNRNWWKGRRRRIRRIVTAMVTPSIVVVVIPRTGLSTARAGEHCSG